ncbi:MAG: hypothetical protein ACI8Z1_001488 [Candidatus Azotimanducaceae bacterium]
MSNPGSLNAWVRHNWTGDAPHWFNALVESNLIGIDWPAPYGAAWSRDQQIVWVRLLAVHQCPLMPESLTIVAPILLKFGSQSQKEKYLPLIKSDPVAFPFNAGDSTGCRLENDNGEDTLVIKAADEASEILGLPGRGTAQIAEAASPALLLHEYLAGIVYVKSGYADHDGHENIIEVAELMLQEDVLTAHFLHDHPRTDAQLSLLVSRSRLTLFSEICNALGYYALIDPAAMPGDNDPIPFENERAHLRALRTLTTRDEMHQQDQIYKEHLDKEPLKEEQVDAAAD